MGKGENSRRVSTSWGMKMNQAWGSGRRVEEGDTFQCLRIIPIFTFIFF